MKNENDTLRNEIVLYLEQISKIKPNLESRVMQETMAKELISLFEKYNSTQKCMTCES